MPKAATTDFEQRLATEVAGFYANPLGFVRTMYPWGEPNTSLAHASGPDVWQAAFLERLGAAVRERKFDGDTPVQPIRMAVSSGHGIGKSTLVAWVVNWVMSTRPHSRGTITANTFTQAQDKTWAAVRKWTPMCLTAPWFEVASDRMRSLDHPESQFCSVTSCREENSEAFAGQHAKTSSSFYIFDEASAVPDAIYEVAEGGLTDGEPMIFLFGNPTWAAVRKWTPMCLTAPWFEVASDRMRSLDHPESQFCSVTSCREENSEAFAGQHAKTSSSFYIFDEASAVPDAIYEVAEGGLTDGEPMIFLFGNPTRSSGMFYRACFGSARNRWDSVTIDSRESAFTNQAQIAEWAEDYGEDSDFFRVRVRGLPPAASNLQFIDNQVVFDAQQREARTLPDDALVCGLDVARGGGDRNVFRFRRGSDARSIPPIRIPGEETRDSMLLVTKAAEVLNRRYDGQPVKMMFVDGTGIGGPIVDRLKQLGHTNVMEVQFGAKATDGKYANMRSYMWGKMRGWLVHGTIDDDTRSEQDMTGPGYEHDKQDRIVLEAKEKRKRRGLDSPDDGDALALTFAAPVMTKAQKVNRPRPWAAFQGRRATRGGRPDFDWMRTLLIAMVPTWLSS